MPGIYTVSYRLSHSSRLCHTTADCLTVAKNVRLVHSNKVCPTTAERGQAENMEQGELSG